MKDAGARTGADECATGKQAACKTRGSGVTKHGAGSGWAMRAGEWIGQVWRE